MPGGRFWYLPAVMTEDEHELTMPVTQVLDWLLDLLSCSLDQLANMLADTNTIMGRDKDTVADARAIRKTLENWHSGKTTPGINKIQEFFNSKLQLRFKGAFDWDENVSLDSNFERAHALVQQKRLSAHSLSIETPIPEEQAAIILRNNQISNEDKRYFYYHLSQRYHTPTVRTIRKRLLYARAFQATYFKLAGAIGVPEKAKRNPNPAVNKAIQVVSIFQVSYNLTIGSCKQTDSMAAEDRLFRETLQNKFPLESQTTLLSINRSDSHLQILANQLNKRFFMLDNDQPVEDEWPFNFPKVNFMALCERKAELIRECIKDLDDSRWLNEAPSEQELYERIDQAGNWSALNSVVGSDLVALSARRAAAWRMIKLARTEHEQAYGLVCVLSQLLNDPDKRSRPTDACSIASSLLGQLNRLSIADDLRPLVLQLEAKHELSKNRLKESKSKFDLALNALCRKGFGAIRGEVARDALAVFACGHYPGFNLEASDKYKLLIVNYGGLEEPYDDDARLPRQSKA
jgi:hypothetical protein